MSDSAYSADEAAPSVPQPAALSLQQVALPHRQQSCLLRWWHAAEVHLLAGALALMVLLPILEMAGRPFASGGLVAATLVVRHLTLVVAMLGAALAARHGRLLALGSLAQLLPQGLRSASRIVSQSLGAGISFWLALASLFFVLSERDALETVAYGIRTWWIQALLPLGFALITARLLWSLSTGWRGRVLGLFLFALPVGAGFLVEFAAMEPAYWIEPNGLWTKPQYLSSLEKTVAALCVLLKIDVQTVVSLHEVVRGWLPDDPALALRWPAVTVLLAATAMGMPIFCTLGGLALIFFLGEGNPIASIPVDQYRLVTDASLPTIPLFTLAGYFLAESDASSRLIRLFRDWFGFFRGGPAVVTVLVCAFFTTFTGASGVTILALGGLLMPTLLKAGFSRHQALGLLTGAGSNGTLFPPCLPLILYAIIAQVPMERMFLGGVLPSLLLVSLTGFWGIRTAARTVGEVQPFDRRKALAASWTTKWELGIPVVALVSLFGGFARPVEAAALTAAYAFAVETLIHRSSFSLRKAPQVMADCGLLVGGVLLILGVAQAFTNYLVLAQVPLMALEWVQATIHSKILFLLCLNVLLVLVGCLMDIYSAIIVVVPLVVPMGLAFGIDPVHMGIIFLANLELGYMTPPIGMNLFLSSYRFNRPVTEVFHAVLPYALLQLAGVLIITYVPFLSTALPEAYDWLQGLLKGG